MALPSASPLAAGERVLDAFAYPDHAAAQKAWLAKDASPPVKAGREGLVFRCPFRGGVDRAYWDKQSTVDLSDFSSFALDLRCDRPEAVRSLSLYFKSGAGWYLCSRPLPVSGPQQVVFPKSDFSAEGKPAGWHRIEAIRLSPWKGAAADTEITARRLVARSDAVLLVRASESAPDAAERNYARRVTERVDRWLSDLDIGHGILDDHEVNARALAGARVVILCYNPNPPPKEVAALRAFVERGGTLVVFYSASPELARVMGMKLGPYLRADEAGRWASFRFEDPGGWQVPERVHQESMNIRPVFPAGPSARIIARWEDGQGHGTGDPAWLASDRGLWMTHVLLEGDASAKQRMLLGLLGRYIPSVWPRAAARAIERAVRVGPYRGLRELSARAGSPRHPGVRTLCERGRALEEKMQTLHRQERYPEAYDLADALHRTLLEIYARLQEPKAGEFRGVWEHDGVGWYPGDWERTCRLLAEQGITALLPNMLWGGVAHYPSTVLPRSVTFQRYGDQLEQCLAACRAHGLELHVWKVCWNLQGAPEAFVERMKNEGRLQVSDTGKTIPWLCPSHPENVALEINSLAEVVRRYPVDGLHLDYVRFPGAEACTCATSRRAFEEWLGTPVKDWPRAVKSGGPLAAKFRRFRVDQMNLFVRGVHKQVRPLRPGLKLSAAVFRNYPACMDTVGQDWAEWLDKGYVDFVCPMNYTTDPGTFALLTRQQLARDHLKRRVVPGLGVTANESELRPDQVIEQILALRVEKAPGFVLFDLSHTLRDEVLPLLRLGLTRP